MEQLPFGCTLKCRGVTGLEFAKPGGGLLPSPGDRVGLDTIGSFGACGVLPNEFAAGIPRLYFRLGLLFQPHEAEKNGRGVVGELGVGAVGISCPLLQLVVLVIVLLDRPMREDGRYRVRGVGLPDHDGPWHALEDEAGRRMRE